MKNNLNSGAGLFLIGSSYVNMRYTINIFDHCVDFHSSFVSCTWVPCFSNVCFFANAKDSQWSSLLFWTLLTCIIYSQTKMYSDTFLTLWQFICYSLETGNKIWKELRVKLCQNKFILIMSDNFDRKMCNDSELAWIAVSWLDNTNLGQPITKRCLILFSLWCKKVTLAIKENHWCKTWSDQSVWIIFVPNFLSVLLVCMTNLGV